MNTTVSGATRHDIKQSSRTIPARTWVGLVLIAIWWPIAWYQYQPFSDSYFFPLWLGFILTVDGLLFRRTGTSPIARNGVRFALVFAVSVPLWWLFEGFNQVLGNWIYHLPEDYGTIEYFLRATLPFATVIPAVFVVSEVVRSFRLNPLSRLPALRQDRGALIMLHLAGWLMIAAVLMFPDYAFPLVWLGVFFVMDPVVTFLGGRSIGSYLRTGDWSPVFNIAIGTLICGFFWEMWNLYALPRWTYSIPYAEFWHIFEMPILGYGGYIPFGLEVFSFYALAAVLLPALRLPAVRVSSIEQN